MMRYSTVVLLAIGLAGAAHAQSVENASKALEQTSLAAGAIGESGFRVTPGVVAVPLGVTALASGAAGVGAAASGQVDVADGFSAAAKDTSHAARTLVEFSNAPLTITDEVVIGQKRVLPQPAPHVPYRPQ